MGCRQPEWNGVVALLKPRREPLSSQHPTISGWKADLNSGEAAGQSTQKDCNAEGICLMVGRALCPCKNPQVTLQMVAI